MSNDLSKHVKELKTLFKKKYGVEYSDEEAQEAANNLIGFFEVLIKIDKENKLNEKDKANKDLIQIHRTKNARRKSKPTTNA